MASLHYAIANRTEGYGHYRGGLEDVSRVLHYHCVIIGCIMPYQRIWAIAVVPPITPA